MNPAPKPSLSHPHSNEILGNEISRLAAQIHAANYRLLVMIHEFDQREAWLDLGLKSCAHWLNWRCGTSLHTGREKVRVAHALVDLPKIAAAFERGQLSYSKMRAVTRVANEDNETLLLNIALSGTAAQLERLVRCELRTTSESEVEENTKAAFEGRYFSWREKNDGSVAFRGSLPAELAAKLIGALESFEPEVCCDDNDDREVNLIAGSTSVNSLNSETGSSTKTSSNPVEEKRSAEPNNSESASLNPEKDVPAGTLSLSKRRADALVALAEQSFNGYQVMLHVPAGNSSHAISLDPGGTIPYAAAERICCDCSIVPVLEGESGELLDIGRKTRTISTAINRALTLRDKGTCRFPGCTHTRHLSAHHIEHWAHGGKTALDNLVSLCWQHHHAVHEGGFGCVAVERAGVKGVDLVFRRPDGVIMPAAFSLTANSGLLEAKPRGVKVDALTCSASDFPVALDVGVVLDGLAFRRRRLRPVPPIDRE